MTSVPERAKQLSDVVACGAARECERDAARGWELRVDLGEGEGEGDDHGDGKDVTPGCPR